MGENRTVTGTVSGTGASINVLLGFKPSIVKVYNRTGLASLMWNDSMPAASGVKTITAGTMAFITTLGISAYDGTEGADNEGFTIGADTDVNVSAETLYWEAFR